MPSLVLDVDECHPGALGGELGHELRTQARSTTADQYHLPAQAGVRGEHPGAGPGDLGHGLTGAGTTTARPTAPSRNWS